MAISPFSKGQWEEYLTKLRNADEFCNSLPSHPCAKDDSNRWIGGNLHAKICRFFNLPISIAEESLKNVQERKNDICHLTFNKSTDTMAALQSLIVEIEKIHEEQKNRAYHVRTFKICFIADCIALGVGYAFSVNGIFQIGKVASIATAAFGLWNWNSEKVGAAALRKTLEKIQSENIPTILKGLASYDNNMQFISPDNK